MSRPPNRQEAAAGRVWRRCRRPEWCTAPAFPPVENWTFGSSTPTAERRYRGSVPVMSVGYGVDRLMVIPGCCGTRRIGEPGDREILRLRENRPREHTTRRLLAGIGQRHCELECSRSRRRPGDLPARIPQVEAGGESAGDGPAIGSRAAGALHRERIRVRRAQDCRQW